MSSAFTVIVLPRLLLRTLVLLGLILLGSAVAAPGAPAQRIEAPQRLSAWLARQASGWHQEFPTGLIWQVPTEREPQRQAQERLVAALQEQALARVVAAMPVTGRVRTSGSPGDWLEVMPRLDPLLLPGDRVLLPDRPSHVTVLQPDGQLCAVKHQEVAGAAEVLQRCGQSPGEATWVIQPDGEIRRLRLGSWQQEAPLSLAPGAWIWQPPTDWPESISDQLARWLSWQGIAPTEAAGMPLRVIDTPQEELLTRRNLQARSASHPVSSSDWGFVGLLQTPTARTRQAGSVSMTLQRTWPYTRTSIFLQPLDGLEAGFRYIDIANRLYGPEALSGSQSYKDKSIDARFKLVSEGRWVPQLAAGILDMGGTGLFGAEYLVASKRWTTLDFSLGLGWGQLGQRHPVANPLSRLFGPGWDQRPNRAALVGEGGTFSPSRYFRGPVGLFGGVQYRPPVEGWLLKAELDGNTYQNEPLSNAQPQLSPINVGAVYRPSPGVELSFGFERGQQLALGLTLSTNLARLHTPKLLDPPRVPVEDSRPARAPLSWQPTASEIAAQTGWTPTALTLEPDRLQVDLDTRAGGLWVRDRIERTLEVLHRDAPAAVEQFQVNLQGVGGSALHATSVDRAAWVGSHTQPPRSSVVPDLLTPVPGPASDQPRTIASGTTHITLSDPTPLSLQPGLDWTQTLGGPNGFVLYQLGASTRASLRLPQSALSGWHMEGNLKLRLIDNYDNFVYDGGSQLPRVRTHIREYLTTSKLMLESLSLQNEQRLSGDHYGAVYAGLFEAMFGGVGAEWLYRQAQAPWSVGADLNRVQQRGFRQDFQWLDYQVTTGHVYLDWLSPWEGLSARLSIGQYLAGDRGATLQMRRDFDNGVSMGAFVTRTNVSAAQFGEGSYDKGIFVELPFDVLSPRSSSLSGRMLWKPLTRDGGAMLIRPVDLRNATRLLDPRTLDWRDAPVPDEHRRPDERRQGR
jgi:hypothetical protein